MANKSRPKQVIFRLSEEEAERFQRKVEQSGMSQQEYILKAVLEKPITNTDGIKEIIPELKRQGANLNQLVKKLNERGYIDYKQELPKLEKELKELWQQLKQYLQNVG